MRTINLKRLIKKLTIKKIKKQNISFKFSINVLIIMKI